jgi:RNA polymerase sigma factor (sigma-70 family)
MTQLHDSLLAHRPRFVSFVRARVPDRAVAEDIVQMAFARSLERGGVPDDPTAAVRWFYRVLRNASTDYHRRHAAESRGLERYTQEPAEIRTPEPRRVCGCVRRALAELKPHYQEMLRRVEIDGASVAVAAAEAGISSGNASVRLHRARRLLGDRLRGICGTCSLDGCADCDCQRSVVAEGQR